MKVTYSFNTGRVFIEDIAFSNYNNTDLKRYIEKMLDQLNKKQIESVAMFILNNYGQTSKIFSTDTLISDLLFTMNI